ncbi:hypothetical protein BDU57DRAFT_408014, partial [Ampelomyces quisqualis]
FTFGLLSELFFSSVTTTIVVHNGKLAAYNGALTKDRYVKYELFKMAVDVVMYIVSFSNKKRTGEQGVCIGGVKLNRYQGWIVWLHFLLWASWFCSCCMAGRAKGAIALSSEE